MTISLTLAFALVPAMLGLAQTAVTPPAQTQAIPPTTSTTPTACLQEVRDYATRRQQQARAGLPQPQTVDQSIEQARALAPVMQQILQARTAMAKECAAKFNVATVAERELVNLANLYTEATQPELARAAIDRAITATSLNEVDRANVLVQAVSLGLQEPKSDARNARLEAFVDELDGLSSAVLDQKFSVHSRMNGFYRGDDIDAGIIKHSTWLIDTAKACTPDLKKLYGPTAVSAYVNMAEAWAGQGRNDEALELLRKAKTDWPDVPSIAARIDPVLERYLLVGRPAAAITAPQWLNGPAGASSIDMKGSVTLLEFTAHWCGPCKESYPGIKRLLAQYGSRGFRVVFSTQFYGYFGAERNLTPEVELERDRAYFEHESLSIPIAVGDRTTSKVVDGKRVYLRDPNDEAYKVGGIPQIHLIDKQGRIRLIMVGYDDANEPRLAKLVEGLLKEK